MPAPFTEYNRLSNEEQDSEKGILLDGSSNERSRHLSKKFHWREIVLVALLVIETLYLLFARPQGVCSFAPQATGEPLYSPARVALKYETKTFTVGIGSFPKTVYQGRGAEAEAAWGELYNHTVFRMNRNEALQLANKTYPISTEPGNYVGSLDIFHQLHCLNKVRLAMNHLYYGDPLPEDNGEDHVNHCIDSVRQSLMCNPDISPLVWQWSDRKNQVVPRVDVAHTCYNFEALKRWALNRRLENDINMNEHLNVDLPDPPIYY